MQEKSEAHKFTHVYVALDYHVAKFDKFALRTDFVSINNYEKLKISKDALVWELLVAIENEYKIPIHRLRVWTIAVRENSTTRVSECLTSAILRERMGYHQPDSDEHPNAGKLRFFVQDLGEECERQEILNGSVTDILVFRPERSNARIRG